MQLLNITIVGVCVFFGAGCAELTKRGNAVITNNSISNADAEFKDAMHKRYGTYEFDKALLMFKRLAEKGHPGAMREYADMLQIGLATPVDQEKAFFFFTKAAELNDSEAIYALGFFYSNGGFGSYLRENEVISIKTIEVSDAHKKQGMILYEKAANMGNQDAMYQLSRIFLYNAMKNNNKDSEEKALFWLMKLEKIDNGDALMVLGCMAYLGVIIPQDRVKAKSYFMRSAKSCYEAEQIVEHFSELGDGESLRAEFDSW